MSAEINTQVYIPITPDKWELALATGTTKSQLFIIEMIEGYNNIVKQIFIRLKALK